MKRKKPLLNESVDSNRNSITTNSASSASSSDNVDHMNEDSDEEEIQLVLSSKARSDEFEEDNSFEYKDSDEDTKRDKQRRRISKNNKDADEKTDIRLKHASLTSSSSLPASASDPYPSNKQLIASNNNSSSGSGSSSSVLHGYFSKSLLFDGYDFDYEVLSMSQVHDIIGLEVEGGNDPEHALILTSQAIGYRTTKTTRGINKGTWIYQLRILPPASSQQQQQNNRSKGTKSNKKQIFTDTDTWHIRFGWGSKEAETKAPVGCDKHSYGMRGADGSKLSRGWRRDYIKIDGLKVGDIISSTIHIPSQYSDQEIIVGSWISFGRNNEDFGIAHSNLTNPGKNMQYYPMVSLYNGARVELIKYEEIIKSTR